jgi:RNA polymerase sigma-70 factor, ECF subfamily
MVQNRALPTALPDMSSLYEEYHTPIYHYVFHLIGNREQAEDLTQETFLKAFRALPSLEPASLKIEPWLYRIATNTTYDALRRRKLVSWTPLQDFSFAVPSTASECRDPDDTYATVELVRKALRMMPPRYRDALLLYERDGFTYAEIAQKLTIAPKGVKMFLFRARQSFRSNYLELERGTHLPSSTVPVNKALA